MPDSSDPTLARRVYNLVRPYTPRDYAEFNGVRAKGVRVFDRTEEVPGYEAELCELVDAHLEEGMTVLEVGGGLGVSAVRIARAIGPSGSLTVYEGSHENVQLVEDTVAENEVPCDVRVRNALVGRPVDLYDEPSGADHVAPEELPPCDALVLDCEGTEVQILAELSELPRVVVVETHDHLVPGCTDAVECLLEASGYEIVERRRHTEDIQVLAAV